MCLNLVWHVSELGVTWVWAWCDVSELGVTCVWNWCDMCLSLVWHMSELGVTCVWAWCDICLKLVWHESELGVTWVWTWCDMCLNLVWHVSELGVTCVYPFSCYNTHQCTQSLLLLEFGTWFVVNTRVFSCVNYTEEVKRKWRKWTHIVTLCRSCCLFAHSSGFCITEIMSQILN